MGRGSGSPEPYANGRVPQSCGSTAEECTLAGHTSADALMGKQYEAHVQLLPGFQMNMMLSIMSHPGMVRE